MVRVVERSDVGPGVWSITLDRPERRNALDHATVRSLLDAQRIVADARVVVLSAEGRVERLRLVVVPICDDPELVAAPPPSARVCGLEQHHRGDRERGIDNNRADGVRDDVAHEDAAVR